MNYYHTAAIVFKNGRWIKYPGMYNHPFEYSNAGVIHTIKGEKIYDHITWYHNDDAAIYVRYGRPYLYKKTLKGLVRYLKWRLGLKTRLSYFKEVGVYENNDVAVYIYKDFTSERCVSFYKDSHDVYIIFGECDCCDSILTDLVVGDNSEEIEKCVTKAIYNWCYENALTWVCDLVYGGPEEGDKYLQHMRWVFGED